MVCFDCYSLYLSAYFQGASFCPVFHLLLGFLLVYKSKTRCIIDVYGCIFITLFVIVPVIWAMRRGAGGLICQLIWYLLIARDSDLRFPLCDLRSPWSYGFLSIVADCANGDVTVAWCALVRPNLVITCNPLNEMWQNLWYRFRSFPAFLFQYLYLSSSFGMTFGFGPSRLSEVDMGQVDMGL